MAGVVRSSNNVLQSIRLIRIPDSLGRFIEAGNRSRFEDVHQSLTYGARGFLRRLAKQWKSLKFVVKIMPCVLISC